MDWENVKRSEHASGTSAGKHELILVRSRDRYRHHGQALVL